MKKSIIRFYQPDELVFGDNCFKDFTEKFMMKGFKKVFILADINILASLSGFAENLQGSGVKFNINTEITQEPTVDFFNGLRKFVEDEKFDSVIGIGGGSVLDTAKLVAALSDSGQSVEDVFGIGKLKGRKLFLSCLPTTAGTGSEVSPNAILLDEKENLKKGVVSEFLVPDMAYADPVLTHTVPPHVTAATGIDALTHCIEAYANKYAHPMTDLYALEGIALIVKSIEKAYENGNNAEARRDLALGSLYGGLCLGTVNTAAVHALSYPLGGEYHIPHGVSNALLLPAVMEKNLPEATSYYAKIGEKIGLTDSDDETAKAKKCIDFIRQLCKNVEIPSTLTEFNVSKEDIPDLTKSAISVQRLLKNNLRNLSREEIFDIYYNLFQ